MRFCEECGARLEDDAKFCEECGAEQEPFVEVEISVTANEDSEYGFCEECGARIKFTDKFCEGCGTVIGQQESVTQIEEAQKEAVPKSADIKQDANVFVPIKSEPAPAISEINASQNSGRKKGVRFLWIPVAMLVLVAVMAGGYFIGQRNGNNQNVVQSANNNGNEVIESNSEDKEDVVEDENKGQQPNESVVPTSESVITPTVAVTPTEKPESPAGKPIFMGYRAVDYIGCVVTIETPDGLELVIDTISATAYISDGEHYLEFAYVKKYNSGANIYYPEEVVSAMAPIDGDEVIICLEENGVNVRWVYHYNGQTDVYYDGWVSKDYIDCIGKYARYLSNSLKYYGSIATGDNKYNPGKQPFEKITDGKMLEVEYSGDDKEKLALGLTYNHELDILRMEFYDYEQDAYLCGYAEGQMYYEEDAIYYLQPIYAEAGIYWEEIPYTVENGAKKYDLTGYDIYCEVRMKVFEEGISLYWSVHEDGTERIYYDDFFEVRYMQRKAYIQHY